MQVWILMKHSLKVLSGINSPIPHPTAEDSQYAFLSTFPAYITCPTQSLTALSTTCYCLPTRVHSIDQFLRASQRDSLSLEFGYVRVQRLWLIIFLWLQSSGLRK